MATHTSPPGVARATGGEGPGGAPAVAAGARVAGQLAAAAGIAASPATGGSRGGEAAAPAPPSPSPAAPIAPPPPPSAAAAAATTGPVLDAVSRLLHDPAFHDVEFFCAADGGVVTANRAFLAARNDFFKALLFGACREGVVATAAAAAASDSSSSSPMARVCLPAASARALRRVLAFLHTGELLPPEPGEGGAAAGGGSGEQEQQPPPPAEGSGSAAAAARPPPTTTTTATVPWRVLLETCGLAQQLLLPEVVTPLARRVAAGLTPVDVGPALSAALEAGLQPVVGQLWRALPRLMPGGAGAGVGVYLSDNGAGGGGGEEPWRRSPLFRRGLAPRFSGDAGFSAAAIAFLLECVPATVVAGPEITAPAGRSGGGGGAVAAAASGGGPSSSISKARRSGEEQRRAGSGGGSLLAGTSAGDGGAARSGGGGAGTADDAIAMPPSPSATSAQQQQQQTKPPASARDGDTAGTTAAAAGPDEEDHHRRQQQQQDSPMALLDDLCDQARTPEERLLRAVLDWAVFELLMLQEEQEEAATAAATATAAKGRHPSSCLPPSHERVLCSLLLRLDWAAIAPRWLERLLRPRGAGGSLLPSASRRADVSRAALLCLHGSTAGRLSFAQTAPANAVNTAQNNDNDDDDSLAPTLPLVRRLARWGGGEVLECAAVPHVTVQSRRPFPTTGRHCFTVSVEQSCDLVWLGLSDGSVEPQGWGGKSKGAWLVGSNDALCHHAQSDRSAYATLCGLGKWGDGAVIGVFLDCDAGESYFALLSGGGGSSAAAAASASSSSSAGAGGELKKGFGGLPTEASTPDDRRKALYAAASIRAPAQLAFRWRPWSWLQREFEGRREEDGEAAVGEEEQDV